VAAGKQASSPAFVALAVLTLVAMGVTLMLVSGAPIEARMGIVQKIFYFHVSSAYSMYVGLGIAALASAMWLWKGSERWDALAVAGAEVGLAFTLVVLTTGPLWGRKAWDVYWVWDPRLTSTLLMGLMFVAYHVLRASGTGGIEKRFAAALALLALPNAFLIHYSVQQWGGQHPQVITGQGGGLAPSMLPAFFTALGTFSLLVVMLIWARFRAERAKQSVEALELRAAAAGLLEDT
jgi:heme exporter protein C